MNTKRVFLVRMPLPGTDTLFTICTCEDAEKAAAVVQAILSATYDQPIYLIVESQIAA